MKTITLLLTIVFTLHQVNSFSHEDFIRNLKIGKRFLSTDNGVEINKKLEDDLEYVDSLLQPMLSHFPSWKNITKNDYDVKDVSGKSGATVYKLTKKNDGKRLFMKVNYQGVNQPKRYKEINVQLNGENPMLTPSIAFGKDTKDQEYYIQEDAGKDFQELGIDPEKIGTLQAKIHKIKNTWYEPFRKELLEDLPDWGKDIPKGNYYWVFSTSLGFLDEIKKHPETHEKFAKFVMAEPISEAGKKLVTSHGDFHVKNAATAADGRIWAIDQDMAAVQYAIGDISYHFVTSDSFMDQSFYLNLGGKNTEENLALFSDKEYHKLTEESMQNQRKFAKAYQTELNMSHTDQDIDKLLYDAMCGVCFMNIWTTLGQDIYFQDLERINKYKDFQVKAHKDESLQKLIRESTIRKAAIKEGVMKSRDIGFFLFGFVCLCLILMGN